MNDDHMGCYSFYSPTLAETVQSDKYVIGWQRIEGLAGGDFVIGSEGIEIEEVRNLTRIPCDSIVDTPLK